MADVVPVRRASLLALLAYSVRVYTANVGISPPGQSLYGSSKVLLQGEQSEGAN